MDDVGLTTAVKAGADVLSAELAVGHDEARPAHAFPQLRRGERIILENVFGVRRDAIGNACEPMDEQSQFGRSIRIVRMHMADPAEVSNNAASLAKRQPSAGIPSRRNPAQS